MLLPLLRRSTATARWVLAWFVLAMGVAVIAPTLQPLSLGLVCASPVSGADADEEAPVGAHSTWQCIQCLHLGAPPPGLLLAGAVPTLAQRPGWQPTLAARANTPHSPLRARAPPLA